MKYPTLIFLFILLYSSSSIAQKDFDSNLEKLIQNDEFEKAKFHLKKTYYNSNDFDTDKEIYYNAKAGFIYLRLGEIDSALYYSKNAIKKIKTNSKKEIKYEAWKSMAYSYCKISKIDSATIYTQQLYEAVDKTNNYEMKRYANILMGIISFQNKLLNESLNYYVKALELTKISKKNQNYKVDYYNLGLTHTMLRNFEEGIKFLKLSETYAIKSNDKRLLGRIYGTTADNYAIQGKNEMRQFYLDKANTVAKSIGDKKLLAMGESHQMQWNFHNGKTNQAYKNGSQIIETLRKEKLNKLETKSDSLMYVMAKKNKQPQKALYFLEKFTKNKLKIIEENGRDKLEEIRAKYELKNKNLIIQKQNLEIIASNRINKITFLIIILFIIIFSAIAFIYFKHKKNIHLIYKKEKEKDLQIKKLQDRINSYALIKNSNNKTNKLDIISKNETDLVPKSQELFEKIMMVLETEKLFLNPDLDQNTIIKIIGTNKKYLYEAVAQNSDLNFRGIINRLRINEAKSIIEQKIINKEEINFSNLFSESGFNSNSSFYRTFKIKTGITPNEYAIEFKKDLK